MSPPPSGPAAPRHHYSSSSRSTLNAQKDHLHIEPTPIRFRIFAKPQAPATESGEKSINEDDLLMESHSAFLVWESDARSPRLAFRRNDVCFIDGDKNRNGLQLSAEKPRPEDAPSKLATQYYDLVLEGRVAPRGTLAAWTFARDTPLTEQTSKDAPSPDLLIVLQTNKFPQTWEEDSLQIGSVRNPYHRVDLVPSSRHVQVYAIGRDSKTRYLIADTVHVKAPQRYFALFETGLPTRWYLPASAVDSALKELKGASISPSVGTKMTDFLPDSLTTMCPYKGTARYHEITLPDGDKLTNIAWSYPEPITAFDARGLISFYAPGNDRLRLVVDGEELL